MNYFDHKKIELNNIIKERKQWRRKNTKVVNGTAFVKFKSGDILRMRYRVKNLIFTFEGLCLKISGKNFFGPNVSYILRNIIEGVGVEMTFAHYAVRTFFFSVQDYKRKKLKYRHSRLFYLRDKLNRESRVKS